MNLRNLMGMHQPHALSSLDRLQIHHDPYKGKLKVSECEHSAFIPRRLYVKIPKQPKSHCLTY